jgi:hypothetical protein
MTGSTSKWLSIIFDGKLLLASLKFHVLAEGMLFMLHCHEPVGYRAVLGFGGSVKFHELLQINSCWREGNYD